MHVYSHECTRLYAYPAKWYLLDFFYFFLALLFCELCRRMKGKNAIPFTCLQMYIPEAYHHRWKNWAAVNWWKLFFTRIYSTRCCFLLQSIDIIKNVLAVLYVSITLSNTSYATKCIAMELQKCTRQESTDYLRTQSLDGASVNEGKSELYLKKEEIARITMYRFENHQLRANNT